MVQHMRRYFVIIQRSDGTREKHPLKEWLRQHPNNFPEGYNTNNTTHSLTRALRRAGWKIEEKLDEVLLIKSFDENYVEEISETEDEFIEEITFGLERDLQSALRKNIGQLEPGLKIIDHGTERISEAGRIDITAEDNNGNIVVIELKAGTADPKVIAQILAYMGAIQEADNKPVRGILVAGDFHNQVILAKKAILNLNLFKYSYKFTFESVMEKSR